MAACPHYAGLFGLDFYDLFCFFILVHMGASDGDSRRLGQQRHGMIMNILFREWGSESGVEKAESEHWRWLASVTVGELVEEVHHMVRDIKT
jgi:hypothetical protein